MKEIYEEPSIEIVLYEEEIVTTSGVGVPWDPTWGNSWDPYQP